MALWFGLLIVGSYAAYTMGANNVANVVGVFSGKFENLSDQKLAFLGGISIAAGLICFGKRSMVVICTKLVRLDAFSALVAVLSEAVVVHIFTWLKIPVSTTQAIVGAILGIGFIKGAQAVHYSEFLRIILGWFIAPLVALILSSGLYAIFGLHQFF